MVSVRKRGRVYEYRIEIASIDGTRKWLTKSGFKTKQEAANYLKEQMVKRSSQIKFIVKVKHYDNLYQDLFNTMILDGYKQLYENE